MLDPEFRIIAVRERRIIDKLLAREFPGRAEIAAQCAAALVKVVDEEGSFAIRPGAGAPRATVRQRVAIEAFYPDREGVEDLAVEEAAFLVPCVRPSGRHSGFIPTSRPAGSRIKPASSRLAASLLRRGFRAPVAWPTAEIVRKSLSCSGFLAPKG